MTLKNTMLILCSLTLLGCAAQTEEPLGSSYAQVKTEQVYNPNATQENLGYVPTGSGARMQSLLKGYNYEAVEELGSTDIGFNESGSSK